MPKVTRIVTEDHDWEAWYIDGVLVDQNHRIDTPRVVKVIPGVTFDDLEVTNAWVEEQGHLPEQEPDVPIHALTRLYRS